MVYYLILQDRIADAKLVHEKVGQKVKQKYQLQVDYIDCYLDMYSGGAGSDSYNIARCLSEKYKNYPVLAWRKLFTEVYEALTKSEEEDVET